MPSLLLSKRFFPLIWVFSIESDRNLNYIQIWLVTVVLCGVRLVPICLCISCCCCFCWVNLCAMPFIVCNAHSFQAFPTMFDHGIMIIVFFLFFLFNLLWFVTYAWIMICLRVCLADAFIRPNSRKIMSGTAEEKANYMAHLIY